MPPMRPMLLLDEQIEVPNGNVMYLDEVSVIGSIPMVNMNNQKLYVVEQTPRAFDFAQTIVALDALAGIVQQARRRTRLAKEAVRKFLPQTFLYIDDMISFMRHSSMLDRLMVTSRHIGLNIVLNSQQYVGLSTLQRKSLSRIGIFTVHARELDGVISELAGKNNASADDLYEAFRIATAKAHGFLWIRRQAKNQDEMLFTGFTKRIVSD